MKSIIKLIAVMLCVVIGALSFAACEKTDVTPSSSETQSGDLASSDTNSKENEMNVTKPESVMFDNDLNTFWKPTQRPKRREAPKHHVFKASRKSRDKNTTCTEF